MKVLGKKIANRLIKKKLTISTAESCTGGLLSSTITSVAESSKVFKLGLVTYSNRSKIKVLPIFVGATTTSINLESFFTVVKIGGDGISAFHIS